MMENALEKGLADAKKRVKEVGITETLISSMTAKQWLERDASNENPTVIDLDGI